MVNLPLRKSTHVHHGHHTSRWELCGMCPRPSRSSWVKHLLTALIVELGINKLAHLPLVWVDRRGPILFLLFLLLKLLVLSMLLHLVLIGHLRWWGLPMLSEHHASGLGAAVLVWRRVGATLGEVHRRSLLVVFQVDVVIHVVELLPVWLVKLRH